MPKMKTKGGAKKRFKLTGTGKIKRKHAYKSHILTKGYAAIVHKADDRNVRQLLAIK